MFHHYLPEKICSTHPIFLLSDLWAGPNFWTKQKNIFQYLPYQTYSLTEPKAPSADIIYTLNQLARKYKSPPIIISTGLGSFTALKYAEKYHSQAQIFLNPVTHCNWYQSFNSLLEKLSPKGLSLNHRDNNTQFPISRLIKMITTQRIIERKILQQPMLFINNINDLDYQSHPKPAFAERMKATCLNRNNYQLTDPIICNDILHWLDQIVVKPRELCVDEQKRLCKLTAYLEKEEKQMEFSNQL